MLDLDCDALLIEMFQNFLKTISHIILLIFSLRKLGFTLLPASSSFSLSGMMMRCYNDCLSRYVSATNSLLLTLSACPQVPQVARRLAEQVLSNCAMKLQTYLTAAVNSLGVSLDRYSKIVALKYDGTFRTLPHDQLVKNEKEPFVSSGKPAPKSKKEVGFFALIIFPWQASDIQSHTGNLVRSRVRGWWPIDKEPQRKKAKTRKQSKMELLRKNKSKAAPASKFAKKSQDDKTESKPEDSNVSREKEDSSEEENLKTVGKSAGAKSRSSKEIPKAGTSKDQGDSGKSKASSKKKEEPSKTTMMSLKSKSGPAKPSSAKGKAAKGKQNLHLPPRARRAMWSLNQKRHRRHQNQLKKGNQLFSGKSQASQTKSAKKRKR
ncbi:hypothetical protein IGI04_031389 [Brassica rapa subsp. trilocularis]|uniref:Uncharacterized protein n=1 Tax=Brassica rapa subsp. trilocularis TaxID=1813537 RepID=A0ABQ7LVZ7_BRACM|nr:hypothetical protein IGI04_031389 [Brassica rapa subsp. trilocularis]